MCNNQSDISANHQLQFLIITWLKKIFSFLYSGGCDARNSQATLSSDTGVILCDGGKGYCSRRNVIGEGKTKITRKWVHVFKFKPHLIKL